MTDYQNEGKRVDMPLVGFLTPDFSSGSRERMAWVIRPLDKLKWSYAQVAVSKKQSIPRLIMELMLLSVFVHDLYNKAESTVQQIYRHH